MADDDAGGTMALEDRVHHGAGGGRRGAGKAPVPQGPRRVDEDAAILPVRIRQRMACHGGQRLQAVAAVAGADASMHEQQVIDLHRNGGLHGPAEQLA